MSEGSKSVAERCEDHQFAVISGYTKISSFLNQICEAADSHKNSLGFWPRTVFEEFARKDDLYVVVGRVGQSSHYAGHLMFERRFPRAHIIQTFVLPEYRRRRLGAKLLAHLRASLISDGFTSIWARVAEDLVVANEFWKREQFFVQRVEQGGASRNRKILVRCHELPSPQLFPASGISSENPLGLRLASSDVLPMFLLDLNVLFDLSPRRFRRDEAISLFQAERMNFCRLAISDEIQAELQRSAQDRKTDPMESFASIFPSFPLTNDDGTDALIKDIGCMVFPTKTNGALSENERSDLRHVATAIRHNLAGVVTNDNAILSAASVIRAKYGIEILSPAAFRMDNSASVASAAFKTSDTGILSLLEVSIKDEPAVRTLLSKLNLPGSAIATSWLPEMRTRIAMRCAVWSDQEIVGYLTWSARDSGGTTIARIAVDETNRQSRDAARILFIYLLHRLPADGPRQVRLELAPQQADVREVAIGFGFRGTCEQRCLSKVIFGKVITSETWGEYRAELAVKANLKLPTSIPMYRTANQQIPLFSQDGNQVHLALEDLESLLSPALFCLPKRPAITTPVQKGFAALLLGHSPQLPLLPHATASLFQERHYLSGPQTLRYFKKGALMLFYESTKNGGSGAIVAIARVREAYHKPTASLDMSDFKRSVLNAESLRSIGRSEIKTVTVFDNAFSLPHHISLETLKRIGCGRPNDLITTRPITDNQLQSILREAFGYAQ